MNRIKEEIINTSYPLFLMRVGICDQSDKSELYQKMWNIESNQKSSTFYHDWDVDDKYIGLQVNTIYDYIDLHEAEMSADDLW